MSEKKEMKFQTEEEKILLKKCKEGDNSAIEQMLNRYKNMVRSRAMTLFLVGADKEDLIQEGMIGLFRAIREYEEERNDSFPAFANLCVTRQMYTAIKSSKTKKNLPLNTYVSFEAMEEPEGNVGNGKAFEGVDPRHRNPEDSLIDRERSTQIEAELNEALSPLERKVLALYSGGVSYTEIGGRLGKDQKAIDNALQRIRKKLKTVLAINARM